MSDRAVYPHPLLDARGEGVVITRSESTRVALAPGRADFLVSARRTQRRSILVTGADAAPWLILGAGAIAAIAAGTVIAVRRRTR